MSSYKNILCYLDTASAVPQSAWQHALRLAAEHGASLTIADVAPEAPWYAPLVGNAAAYVEEFRAARSQALQEKLQEALALGLRAECVLLDGNPFLALTQQVLRGRHDLLINTAMGGGRMGALFGATAKRLVRKCPSAVMITAPDHNGPFRHICVAVDPRPRGSSQNVLNQALLERGLQLAASEGATLTVLHAWQIYGEMALLSRTSPEDFEVHREQVRHQTASLLDWLLEPYAERLGGARIELRQGDPVSVLPAFVASESVDLTLIGTVACPAIAGLLVGNTAEQLIHGIGSSLLALKPEGFKSPVALDN
jgi:nucleotide-binding universal stress UspA family protein